MVKKKQKKEFPDFPSADQVRQGITYGSLSGILKTGTYCPEPEIEFPITIDCEFLGDEELEAIENDLKIDKEELDQLKAQQEEMAQLIAKEQKDELDFNIGKSLAISQLIIRQSEDLQKCLAKNPLVAPALIGIHQLELEELMKKNRK